MFLDPTPSEALISHPPTTTEASDDEHGDESINITPGVEWVARVDMVRQAMEILGKRLNEDQEYLKQLEGRGKSHQQTPVEVRSREEEEDGDVIFLKMTKSSLSSLPLLSKINAPT
ncbi:hypothetical protein H5410_050179 [Solanum commersonii]|uniref:Uncharacterized protein n=1 Tax=Solanum commersonii TaxID=4109 RepID=A0A9J5WX45_SOLCO|nr:hypothetical protein H5410_050179 [Solanum commersonii]